MLKMPALLKFVTENSFLTADDMIMSFNCRLFSRTVLTEQDYFPDFFLKLHQKYKNNFVELKRYYITTINNLLLF